MQDSQNNCRMMVIWFTDNTLFTLALLKNSLIDWLYAPVATKKKDVRTLSSLMVSVGMLVLAYTLIWESHLMKSIIVTSFCHDTCSLPYVGFWAGSLVHLLTTCIRSMIVFWYAYFTR